MVRSNCASSQRLSATAGQCSACAAPAATAAPACATAAAPLLSIPFFQSLVCSCISRQSFAGGHLCPATRAQINSSKLAEAVINKSQAVHKESRAEGTLDVQESARQTTGACASPQKRSHHALAEGADQEGSGCRLAWLSAAARRAVCASSARRARSATEPPSCMAAGLLAAAAGLGCLPAAGAAAEVWGCLPGWPVALAGAAAVGRLALAGRSAAAGAALAGLAAGLAAGAAGLVLLGPAAALFSAAVCGGEGEGVAG